MKFPHIFALILMAVTLGAEEVDPPELYRDTGNPEVTTAIVHDFRLILKERLSARYDWSGDLGDGGSTVDCIKFGDKCSIEIFSPFWDRDTYLQIRFLKDGSLSQTCGEVKELNGLFEKVLRASLKSAEDDNTRRFLEHYLKRLEGTKKG